MFTPNGRKPEKERERPSYLDSYKPSLFLSGLQEALAEAPAEYASDISCRPVCASVRPSAWLCLGGLTAQAPTLKNLQLWS